jgi:hypothetical protein
MSIPYWRYELYSIDPIEILLNFQDMPYIYTMNHNP